MAGSSIRCFRVNRVTLAVGQLLPVSPCKRTLSAQSACLKSAKLRSRVCACFRRNGGVTLSLPLSQTAKAKGAIKEGAGKLSNDKDLETEGKIDKAKGSAHNAAGDVKDAVRDAADALKK
jgi:uncharacterized protein YjbJ (UPF0337 family)